MVGRTEGRRKNNLPFLGILSPGADGVSAVGLKCRDAVPSDAIEHQRRMTCEHIKISIGLEERYAGANSVGGNEAVDQLTNGLTAAAASSVQRGSILVVGG